VVHQPPMLFLDEATAGVDPVSRREFWDYIYQLAGEGVSILATTHYMDEAEYCNKVGMMYDGRLIKIASPDSIKEDLNGKMAAIECDPMNGAEKYLRAQPEVLEVSLHGATLHALLIAKKDKARLVKGLKNEGMNVVRFEFIQPSLEDMFITLIENQRTVDGTE
jgi:ABC-2 type transport system ATP-binding protein